MKTSIENALSSNLGLSSGLPLSSQQTQTQEHTNESPPRRTEPERRGAANASTTARDDGVEAAANEYVADLFLRVHPRQRQLEPDDSSPPPLPKQASSDPPYT